MPVLFQLLATCNRSTPHQKIVGHGLRALTNIAKLAELRPPLCEQPECLTTLVDLAQGCRDKTTHKMLWDVMQLLCELVLRGPASWRTKVAASTKGSDCAKRLDGLHGLLSRALLKESGNTATTTPKPAVKKAPAAAKPTGKTKGTAASVAQMELAPRCIGALKAVRAALL